MHTVQGSSAASRLPDRWVRLGRTGRWAGFTVCGLIGLVLALGWTMTLAITTGRPAWLVPLMAGAMVTALVVTAEFEVLVTGRPRLVCFHSEAAALAAAAVVVALASQPILSTLDIATPGLAVFLACGRLGCLVAGCCHGLPSTRGIRYGPRHVEEGLAPEFAGVTLLPVAAIEAAGLSVLAVITTVVVLTPTAAGTALAGYLLMHAGLRFWLEFLRGDRERPRFGGLSEAQWTALGVTGGVVWAVTAGWTGLPIWLPLTVAAVLVAGVVSCLGPRPRTAKLDADGRA
jgi:prolipoprotein diacylglyceryltransferase